MEKKDYWIETVASSFDEHKITATLEQISSVAADIQISHENIGLAFYEPASDGGKSEIEKLKKQLSDERSKETCNECKGKGGWNVSFGTFTSPTTCHRCQGTGRVLPRDQKVNH